MNYLVKNIDQYVDVNIFKLITLFKTEILFVVNLTRIKDDGLKLDQIAKLLNFLKCVFPVSVVSWETILLFYI